MRPQDVLEIEPVVARIGKSGGRWLAKSPAGAPLQIGTLGGTEQDARARFIERRDRWADLADERLAALDEDELRHAFAELLR